MATLLLSRGFDYQASTMRAVPAFTLLALLVTGSTAFAQTEGTSPPLPALPPPDPPSAPVLVPAPLPRPANAADATLPVASPAPIVARGGACDCTLVHHGFYLSMGLGPSHTAVWGDGPNGSVAIAGVGASVSLAIGGGVARGLALAATLRLVSRTGPIHGGPQVTSTTTYDATGQSTSNTSSSGSGGMILFGAQVDWFPVSDGGWHVGGVIGLGSVDVTDAADNLMSASTVGFGLFGGYQWWLGPGWSLGLSAVFMGTPSTNLRDSNGDTGYRVAPLSLAFEGTLLRY